MEITTTRTVTSYNLEGSAPTTGLLQPGGHGEVQIEIQRGENGGKITTRTTKTTSNGSGGSGGNGGGGGSGTIEYSSSSSSRQTGSSSQLSQAQVRYDIFKVIRDIFMPE